MDGTVILLVGLLVVAVYIAFDQRRKLKALTKDVEEAHVDILESATKSLTAADSLIAAGTLFQGSAEKIVSITTELTKAAIVISAHAEASNSLLGRVEAMIRGQEHLDSQIRDLHTELLEIRSDIQSREAEADSFGGRR